MKRLGLILSLVFVFAIPLAAQITVPNWNGLSTEEIDLIAEIRTKISSYFYGQRLSDEKLLMRALKSMVGALGDPHSMLLSPDEYAFLFDNIFVYDTLGRFNGDIGIDFRHDGFFASILKVEAGSSAEQAGLKKGERIYTVNGEDVSNLTYLDVKLAILGQVGSNVILEVGRGAGETIMVELKRTPKKKESQEIPKVEWRIIDSTIIFIQIPHFSEVTSIGFRLAVREALWSVPSPKFIIDVRDNLGGWLANAGDILAYWLDPAEVYCIEKTEKEEVAHKIPLNESREEGYPRLKGYRTVVLVDGMTASAAEVFAGALQDKGYPLVGERTYGKGSMQNHIRLKNGYRLFLTGAHWLTPKGRPVNKIGIEPTIGSPQGEKADPDRQLQKAIEILKSN